MVTLLMILNIISPENRVKKICTGDPFSTKLLCQKAVSSENGKGKGKSQGKLAYPCYKYLQTSLCL